MKAIIFSIIFIFTVTIANNSYAGSTIPSKGTKKTVKMSKRNKKRISSQRTKCNSRAGAKKKAYYNSIQYR